MVRVYIAVADLGGVRPPQFWKITDTDSPPALEKVIG